MLSQSEQLTLALCGVRFAHEPFALTLATREQWSPGETAILRYQEAKQVRDIGSLIFETPIQHDYEASIEVRSLLPTERLGEMDGRLAVTDEDSSGNRYVKFWVDEAPNSPVEGRTSALDDEVPPRASHAHVSVPPFPSLSARDGEQAPPSPERRDRPPQDHLGQGRGFWLWKPRFWWWSAF